MKNMNLVLSVVSSLVWVSSAFAGHGVEKILPADASDVQVAGAEIDQVLSGQTLISDGEDGPVYENNYSPALGVTVTFNSKDPSDDATALSNDNDPTEVVVGGPTLTFELPVTAAEVAAINAGTLDPKSLVAIAVNTQSVQFSNPEFTDACRFDNDSSQPENPSCIKNVITTETRPVLDVSRK